MTKPSIGKNTETGRDLYIDVPRLMSTRLLLQADSGGGKTWVLKRILEQTHAHVQQIVIDPEGEFSTLREKFDYLLCAPEGADAIATPKTAAILARKLRETRVSAVIDIFDLRPQEQKHYVRVFIEELLVAPKSLWNPCILVIDEAQIFAPENDKAESLPAIMDLRGRGRKRGLCPILATPRLAQLSKDAAAGMQNKLIGVTTLDLDVNRAARELSLSPKDAVPLLRNLEPGEFYCFGPAITRTITKVKVGPIQTPHGQHTAGKDTRPPAPSEKIKGIIANLTDLPKEAEQEARTITDFRRENAQLRRDLTAAKRAQPSATPVQIKTIEKPVVGVRALAGIRKWETAMRRHVKDYRALVEKQLLFAEYVQRHVDRLMEEVRKVNAAQNIRIAQPKQVPPQDVIRSTSTIPVAPKGNGALPNLSAAARKVLAVLAQFEEGCTAGKLTLLTGYRYSGGFKNSLSELRMAGLIVGGNTDNMRITDAGLALGPFEALPQGRSLVDYWLNHRSFGPCERKILAALIEESAGLNAHELCARTGYQYSGGFKNALSNLRTAGVMSGRNTGTMRASEDLL